MRTLVSNGVRPRIGHLSTKSVRSSQRSNRRTVGVFRARKLSFNDAFTILLAPILGTALIADTTWKNKQQRDWNTRIAEVLDDLAVLQEKEVRAWQSMQVRSIHNGLTQQRRFYTTQATKSWHDEDLAEEIAEPIKESGPHEEDEGDIRNGSENRLTDDNSSILRYVYDSGRETFAPKSDTEQSMILWHNYEKLVASRLALQWRILARREWMRRRSTELAALEMAPEEVDNMDQLLVRLRIAENELRSCGKTVSRAPPEVDLHIDHVQEGLDNFVRAIAESYKSAKIKTRVMVNKFTHAVTQTKRPLSVTTYTKLLEAVSMRGKSDRLPYFVVKAMEVSRQRLPNRALWAVIWQYGRFKHPGRFDDLLLRLTRVDSHMRLVDPWEQILVGGLRIAAPVNRDPTLLNILIRVGLQCQMPHKAEAWAILMCKDMNATKFAFVFRNMLHYCSDTENWTLGQQWLEKAIMWAALLNEEASDALVRTILRILDMCVSCNQRSIYETILQAAVKSCLQPNFKDRSRPLSYTERVYSIRKDWNRRLEAKKRDRESKIYPSAERARLFQETMARELKSYTAFIGVSDPRKLDALSREYDVAHNAHFDPSTILSPQRVFSAIFGTPAAIKAAESDRLGMQENSEGELLKDLASSSQEQVTDLESISPKTAEDVIDITRVDQSSLAFNQVEPRQQPAELSQLHALTEYQNSRKRLTEVHQRLQALELEKQRLKGEIVSLTLPAANPNKAIAENKYRITRDSGSGLSPDIHSVVDSFSASNSERAPASVPIYLYHSTPQCSPAQPLVRWVDAVTTADKERALQKANGEAIFTPTHPDERGLNMEFTDAKRQALQNSNSEEAVFTPFHSSR